MRLGIIIAALAVHASAGVALAGMADLIGVEVSRHDGVYRFAVTVSHFDEGWDHYADGFEVIGADGTIYATRVLHHPHVNEQPFTRVLDGVMVPEGTVSVTLRAHDRVHGNGGLEVSVDLP